MEFIKGKLYQSVSKYREGNKNIEHKTVVLCTGKGRDGSYESFSGVLVKQENVLSPLRVGEFSTTWSASRFSQEYTEPLTLDNNNIKSPMGDCAGDIRI